MLKEFLENSEIFITGGSGMVGKAIIETLLRKYNVKCIYILLREKKKMSVEQRLEKLKNAQIFNILRKSKPFVLDKMIAIPGDAVKPRLGITPEYAKMMENVNIIFHSAATVRFDEPIRMALKLNCGATFEALKFAETLSHLKVFMHVSTFFSNPYLEHVEPKIYEPPMDWRLCLKLIDDNENQDTLDFITKKLITGFANTYTFTKNLAESMVNDYRDRLPVAIFRPSIVIFALHEPQRGFPPGIIGAMGLFALVSAGILKTVFLGDDILFDLTPQDLCVKFVLYYAMHGAQVYQQKNNRVEEAPIYMLSSYKHNHHTFKHMAQTPDNYKLWYCAPMLKSFMIPGCTYTSNRLYYKFLVFTKQILPAAIVDSLLKLFGRPPVLMSVVRRAYIALEVMQPFMFNNYTSTGVSLLPEAIAELNEDRIEEELTYVNTEEGLVHTILSMIFGLRILFKETPEMHKTARRILKFKLLVYNVIRIVLAYFLLRWLCRTVFSWMDLQTS